VPPVLRRKRIVLLAVLAVMLSWFAGSPSAARAEERTVTLVGDLQSELGCSDDWQPVCTATDFTQPACWWPTPS